MLGIEIHRDRSCGVLGLSLKSQCPKNELEIKINETAILRVCGWNIMQVCTRPNIAYATSKVGRL